MSDDKMMTLAGACIKISGSENTMMTIAAKELSKYLYQLYGKVIPIAHEPSNRTIIELKADVMTVPVHFDNTSQQAFRIYFKENRLLIEGASPLGTLYGVYALLEELGVGFFLGGDTFPENRKKACISRTLNIKSEPCFAVRGSNLHGNLLTGSSGWGDCDWRFYIDQMARMRCNMFMIHFYKSEPCAGYESCGRILDQGPPHSSVNAAFGINPLPTSEFSFGMDSYFDQEIFGAPPVSETKVTARQIKGMETIFRNAIRYARLRGISAAAGFEIPIEVDCTDKKITHEFEEKIRQFVRRYPELPYFCVWQPEGRAIAGEPVPKSREAKRLIAKYGGIFKNLGHERRIYGGIHLTEFLKIAYRVIKKEAPNMRLVAGGWGGDCWMRFADYAAGLDKLLPKDVILTCHDNIDISFGPEVSKAWSQLPPERQRWAQPWLENDALDMWTRQANVEGLAKLLPDAINKGCQGVLGLHWRIGDFEEEISYLARYAWRQDMSTDEFYEDTVRRMFGESQVKEMGEVIRELQRMRFRWSGMTGPSGLRFHWESSWPFEFDRDAVNGLCKSAQKVGKGYRENTGSVHDGSIKKIIKKLRALNKKSKFTTRERDELQNIQNDLLELYERALVSCPSLAPKIHGDLIWPINHIIHQADHGNLKKKLLAIREKLIHANEQIKNSDRYEYLLGTIDAVLIFDEASPVLGENGVVPELLKQAEKLKRNNRKADALKRAIEAYEAIIAVGIEDMLKAQVRKLNAHDEWGVLALMNLKAMPSYWCILAEAEKMLPVFPPRELNLFIQDDAVNISWRCEGEAKQFNIYRRKLGQKKYRKINRKSVDVKDWAHSKSIPLAFYVDKPETPGVYEYIVRALSKEGWESPISQRRRIEFGGDREVPRIFGRHQDYSLIAERPHHVSVIIPFSDNLDDQLMSVNLKHRGVGQKTWNELPMFNKFRCCYTATIPAFTADVTAIEYYVEVETHKGETSVWPSKAINGHYWTSIIASE